jgi:hypothetical protein
MSAEHMKEAVTVNDDGESGLVVRLTFRSRSLHRQLSQVDESARASLVRDALDVGAEVLDRASRHADLAGLHDAVERLDGEATRIVKTTTEAVQQSLRQSVLDLTAAMQADDGPFAPILAQFDLTADGNVIDLLRELVSTATAKATKQAVRDLTEATQDNVERLARSMAVIEKVAEVEQTRLDEARRGTAKGLDHEATTEMLLGELVAVGGDSLDDVSTVPGLRGSKKGDKTITPRGGVTIVAEDKCTGRISESKARTLLDDAMANRGARLAMLIVEDESKVPGRQPFHLIDDDKVVVVADRVTLRLVYGRFRAKAIERCREDHRPDDAALQASMLVIRRTIEDIEHSLERFRLLRTEHTKASKAIGQAAGYVDEIVAQITDRVVEALSVIESLADKDDGTERAA